MSYLISPSAYYRKAAARRRGAAVLCALCMTYASAALSYALLLGMPVLAILCGLSFVLLGAAGLRFLHLAAVLEERAGRRGVSALHKDTAPAPFLFPEN